MSARGRAGDSPVVAGPALTRAHREVLNEAEGITFFVHLYGTFAVLSERMSHRIGRDMPQELLVAQLGLLERLHSDELGIQLDVTRNPEDVVGEPLAPANLAESACGSEA